MRTQISISGKAIFLILLLSSGFFFIFRGVHEKQKYSQAIKLESLNPANCVEGTYVIGEINSYVRKNISDSGSENYSGTSQSYLTLGALYEIYTIPMGDQAYICVMAKDDDTKKKLEALYTGDNEPVLVEGEIIRSPVEINKKWYEGVEGFDPEKVEPVLILRQAQISERYKIISPGITLLVIGVFLLLSTGFDGIIAKREVRMQDSPRTAAYTGSRNVGFIKQEMLQESYKLKSLEKQLTDLQRGSLFRLPVLAVGIFVFTNFDLASIKIIGILLILSAIRSILRGFIHSGNGISLWFAKVFNVDSLSVRVNQSRDKVNSMREAVERAASQKIQ